jgi:hypothetical protein
MVWADLQSVVKPPATETDFRRRCSALINKTGASMRRNDGNTQMYEPGGRRTGNAAPRSLTIRVSIQGAGAMISGIARL